MPIPGWKQDIFLQIISIFCVLAELFFANKWHVSFTLVKNKCSTKQYHYDSTQYHFCPHVALQSPEKESSLEEL